MKNLIYMLLLLALYTENLHSSSFINNSLHKMHSFFTRYSCEKIDHKEISTKTLNTISIDNNNGPITIKTGWKKDYLCLKTIRRAKKQTDLDAIKIVADSTKPHHLAIRTKYEQKKINGSVEYELIVPASLGINLKTDHGDICINDVQGPLSAITNNGLITINNTQNNVNAQTTTGNISIECAHGTVNALSRYGTIAINNAYNSITAQSSKGKIFVDYKKLPATSTVKLDTTSGHIALTLPKSTDATIKGTTTYGTVLSDHSITLSPYTTKLDSTAWTRFKKEVNGTIGTGLAHISLTSTYGNVKILETKVT